MGGLGASWLVNPGMFAAGGALVALPIIIHLLNQRKFRVIEWAAMEFLLEADQRNRRRIQLEELLLLALRCLAVLLVALLVGRPFWPSSLMAGWLSAGQTERIVLLDDSPSMAAAEGATSAFEAAKMQLAALITGLAQQGGRDSVTLVVTSRPTRPIWTAVPVNEATAGGLLKDIEGLAPSDLPCRLAAACAAVKERLGGKRDKLNRVGYVLTDLRQDDWLGTVSQGANEALPADAVLTAVRELAEALNGCFVADLGHAASNLSLARIAPEDRMLLGGVTARFQVTVRNSGTEPARSVPVQFLAGGSLPLSATLETIPANGEASIPFSLVLPASDDEDAAFPIPLDVRAEIVGGQRGDALAADNTGYYAARVHPGIPTLVVDGDPSAETGRAETFFLQRALTPPGVVASGVRTEVIGAAEFETRPLTSYQVVYLCNLYHLSEQRRKSLEDWVKAGGGLVIWPGGQVDERFYNEELFRGGEGLLPRKLDRALGDSSEKTWQGFSVEQSDHAAVRVFSGDAAPLLESTKIFQWWQLEEPAANATDRGSVVMRFTNAERSAAVIDRSFGEGRVVLIAVPADTDWSNWPEDASYVIFVQELTRHLAQSGAQPLPLTVGEPLRAAIDLSQVQTSAVVTRPDGTSVTRQAVDATPAGYVIEYDETDRRGFYSVQLAGQDGPGEKRLFAANLAATEGNLARVEPVVLERAWSGSPVQLVHAEELLSLMARETQSELWFWVLIGLVGVLFGEQVLATAIGRSR